MFADTIQKLDYNPTSQQGAGFLPPIFRGSQHILFLMASVNDEQVEVTTDDALTELKAAKTHFDSRVNPTSVSTPTLAKAILLDVAMTQAIEEYGKWDDKARTANLKDLSNRIAQFASDLDRELTGLTESDPGTQI